ncbi:hypothetical protein OHA18_36535 [Kribbella sp. NBC_00709]|uniref:hypothetical protein n=1 Tax=Kribbella sp. NBC_00709 TaxID=2975972 RepID=UPI002E29BC22|nr:hypothetical protein [Kribbella sp. NBC_00709]
MGDANEEELYKRAQMDERLRVEEQTRQRALDLEKFRQQEDARKAAEEAAKKANMVADPEPAVAKWPDDGFQAAAPGRLDGIKGALGIGAAGDAALASRLLNDGRPPATEAVSGRPGAEGGGVRERVGAVLNAGVAKPAVER